MLRVLVDAGPLYALVDPKDGQHARAVEELQRLTSTWPEFVTTTATLMETHALILKRLGPEFALSWLAEVQDRIGLLEFKTADLYAAMKRVQAYPDQKISLFDAGLAELSARLRVPVWTFDFHFDVMGVEVWR